ncbi:MAG TPA: T9SS type A sorting domain-containing protein [Bacteroidia bacterium]|jgi:photosystem II stability/assembly factor-like uncharacterized protein|nr:T9SS type A sorting domain-containing protein [Bacteroidia bacterium]
MKKQLLFSAIIFLFSFQLFSQYNWYALPNAPKGWRLDDCYFLNPDTGWVINPRYNYLTPNTFGQIWRTNDGGNTWQLQKDSSETFFRSIGFADAQHGWVGNLGMVPYTSDTLPFYQTIDGGFTWNPVNLMNPRPKGICGISVVTDSIIYAYGRYSGPAVLIKTSDKGNTWTSQDMSAYASGLIDGFFFNKDTGFVSGSSPTKNATILSTYDGGATWQVRYLSTRNDTDGVWKFSFPSRDTGYASVENWAYQTSNRYFLKTVDGGLTWAELPFIPNYDLQGIGFINDSVGWIGGDNYYRTFKTMDGGMTWNPDFGFGVATPPYLISTGYVMNRFRRFGDTLLYASGNTVYKMQVGVNLGSDELQSESSSIDNFPNPFFRETTVTYRFSDAERNVLLDVYTTTGEKIISKNLGSQNAGEHQYVFEADLAAGIYYCTITTEKTELTKKIVVVK